jgi:branched-chain amino acid transport system substrate-binding protein
MKTAKLAGMALLIAIISLASCGRAEVTVFNEAWDEEIHIGVVYPVALRDRDTYLHKGISLAVERVNAEGGVMGRTLHTVIKDDENDAHLAKQIAALLYEQGITAVIGHWSTNICYFLVNVYEANQVVMLTPAATGTNLFDENSRYVFRMGANHNIYSEAIARHISEAGLSRVAIFFSDDEYGNDFSATLERALSRHGVLVVDRVTSITPASIGTVAERWNAFGTEAVIVAALMPGIVEPIQLIRRADLEIPIFGADNFERTDFPIRLEGYMDGLHIAAFNLAHICQDFMEAFRDAFGHDPDVRALSGYAAVRLIADAMEAKGTTDSRAIADFFSTLYRHPTIFGELSYNYTSQEFELFNVTIQRLGDVK